MWVTFSIYLTVIGWAYAIGTMLAMLQDRGFRQALAVRRFASRVRALQEPFVLVAGYGRAGRRLARSLDAIDRRFVVVDVAQDRIDELALEPFRVDVPALAIDARNPDHLLLAGLGNPACATVVALTGDDEVNLAVAMAARPAAPRPAGDRARGVAGGGRAHARVRRSGRRQPVRPVWRLPAHRAARAVVAAADRVDRGGSRGIPPAAAHAAARALDRLRLRPFRHRGRGGPSRRGARGDRDRARPRRRRTTRPSSPGR